MTSFALSQIRNFRISGAGIPRQLEIDAVIETITEGWDYTSVSATAERGISDADRDGVRDLIQTEGLTLSQEEAEEALLGWCRERVEERGEA